MSHEYVIMPEDLSAEAFAPYGQAILLPPFPALKTGEDWSCWGGLGKLGLCDPEVGIVITRPTKGAIRAMEREPKTEFLIPISGPVIQTVALPGDPLNHSERPNAATARAFIVRPGQAIIMSPGTWHWAALPLSGETLYYFITQLYPTEPGRELSPWIPFHDGDTVRVRIAE